MCSKSLECNLNCKEGKKENNIQIVYLILAHNNPDMLGRLVNALDGNRVHFFIHVDKKADLETFLPYIPLKQNVHLLVSRVKVFWGGYSQVQATLNLMEEVIKRDIDFKYAVLLSGSHYPIKSNNYILNKLRTSDCEYLQFATIREVGAEIKKINSFCLYDYVFFNPRTLFFDNKLLNKIGRMPGILVGLMFAKALPKIYKRKMVQNIIPYTGANWWALTKPCIKYILDYTKNNKDYVEFFRFSVQPDESFFHTIICNSIFKVKNSGITMQSLVGDVIERGKFSKLKGLSLTFTKCSTNGSPKTLSEADITEIRKEMNYFSYPQFFARKFDPKYSDKLLDIIDKELLNHRKPHESQS